MKVSSRENYLDNQKSDDDERETSKQFFIWGLLIIDRARSSQKWSKLEINLLQQLAEKVAIAVREADSQKSDREVPAKMLSQQPTQPARQFLQTIIDCLPIAVYVKDAKAENFGQFKLWNKATEKIFEIEADRVLGKTVHDYFSLEQAEKLLQEDLEVFARNQVLEISENYWQPKKARSKIIHKVKVPLYDRDRQPEHLLCIAEDITLRQQAARELQHKSEALAAFSDNLKQLHRLNTTNYQSLAELFKDHLKTGCQIFACTTGIVGLIEKDIYRVYAIESNQESLYPQLKIPLKDTYCAEVVKANRTVSYNWVGKVPELCSHPLYQNLQFESYLGTPIFVDGLLYAVLSFVDLKARSLPFSDREKETIEMMAESIGRFIFADRVEKKRQQAEELLTQTKEELEIRVRKRTIELEIANELLQKELKEREQIQFELQASQDSFQESERRWRSLLENVRLLVVGLDERGQVNYVNPYFLELTGYTRKESLEQNWFEDFVPSQDKNEAREIHEEIIKINGISHQYHQQKIVTKFGEFKTIAWNTTQLRDVRGMPIGMMCIGKDITETQAIERMKDEFISVVSHELRTPLTSIRGALGLLATGVLNNRVEQKQRVIEIATQSTDRLVRLVDDILELEKLESGKIELEIAPIKIQDLILQAVNQIQLVATHQQIELQVTELDGVFYGDSDRLLQVLTNLLSNAIKFSEPQSTVWLDAKLATTTERPSQWTVVFAVRDRGIGIPIDRLESIFERFYQVDGSDSRGKDGTGLGLAICRSIVEQHQGKIWAESIYGEGTTFYFRIPVSFE